MTLSKLQKELETQEGVYKALLDDLAEMDSDQLVQRPIPHKWSLLEIIEHLVLAEREVLDYLPDPSQLIEGERDLKAHLSYLMVMAVLGLKIPVKAPSQGMLPKGNTSLEELRRQLEEIQDWLRDYVNDQESNGLRKAVFRHPVAGAMTVGQTIHLRRVHLNTHLSQIKRLKRLLTRTN